MFFYAITIVLFLVVFYTIIRSNKAIKKKYYIYKGMKLKSFLYHDIALAYEDQEVYSDDEGEFGFEVSNVGSWKADKKGRGYHVTEKYILIVSGDDPKAEMQVPRAVAIAPEHKDLIADISGRFANNKYGVGVMLNSNFEGCYYIALRRNIDGDPTQKEARYYIHNCYEEKIQPMIDDIYTYYSQYKANLSKQQ